ncbi:MaoC family dehydratase [Mesorhizobium xinjiangense]|uniref:MaoC family dehydratase n=1 Tax=Mesorhizobium xinjiangense TaxID=2678685 RepID=UPI0012ED8C92|nr:MaoC/PaaZ C-terminal domain-containing protein [Mesorhizobium xinjiangense]
MNGGAAEIAALRAMVGHERGVSSWVTVDQEMIDRFADVTRDRQWIHVDVDRAKRESPYGAPVAHGYLTLSLLAGLSYEIGGLPKGIRAVFNYGLDKVRFLAPVRVGSKIRMRSTLLSVEERAPDQYLMKSSNTVEIDGEDKPALIAETLTLIAMEPAAG